ncbi:MAG TPA: hypothetical protein VJS92_11750 [Candidatus Polarisedimenticolaceae bacterium]|nr:hypothetical protein [Candidatus Polarisedimenticolaceae bacterium]
MTSIQRWLLWTSTALALVSGLGYAAMRYLLVGDDPFSAYHHPLQPWALATHVIGAPVLLFVLGWFWGNHVVPKLARGRPEGRGSGLFLVGLTAVMTLSAYVAQSVAAPPARTALAWIHGLSGTLFVILLVAHFLRGRRRAE